MFSKRNGLMVGAMALSATLFSAPAWAQDVRAGVEAWQQGNYATAVAIWKPLAEKDSADASFNLAQAYRLGRGVPVNLALAQHYLKRAAGKGHVDAQSTLGLLLFDAGDIKAGLDWLGKAADAGEARAMLVYGTALFNGDKVERNPVMAYAYVSRAAAQGLAPAKATLADMDAVMPLTQRQKGVKIAQALAGVKSEPSILTLDTAQAAKASPSASAPVIAKSEPALAKVAEAKPEPKKAKPVEKIPVAEAKKPAPKPAATGVWRIQLGAFSQKGSAQSLYASLKGKLAGRDAFYVNGGKVTRLQVGPYSSRDAAAKACASLGGQACFPVKAK